MLKSPPKTNDPCREGHLAPRGADACALPTEKVNPPGAWTLASIAWPGLTAVPSLGANRPSQSRTRVTTPPLESASAGEAGPQRDVQPLRAHRWEA
eukprot:941639-Pyramimonas_sp.AAC.1